MLKPNNKICLKCEYHFKQKTINNNNNNNFFILGKQIYNKIVAKIIKNNRIPKNKANKVQHNK